MSYICGKQRVVDDANLMRFLRIRNIGSVPKPKKSPPSKGQKENEKEVLLGMQWMPRSIHDWLLSRKRWISLHLQALQPLILHGVRILLFCFAAILGSSCSNFSIRNFFSAIGFSASIFFFFLSSQ